ncbi:MAG TPA: response regulator [Burkholderiales bacterium]
MTAAHEPIRVLLVDDNRDVADSLACALALDGVDVEVAYEAESALDKARKFVPQAVILDLILPGIDGYVLAQSLRGACSGAFLVAYTGDGTEAARLRCANAGIDAYVLKPADPRELLGMILRATGRTSSEAWARVAGASPGS